MDYIRILRGRFIEINLSANARTDFNELRSSCRTSTWAFGLLLTKSSFTLFAASIFLAAIMTCAPLRANTLAVSAPIPLAPPSPH